MRAFVSKRLLVIVALAGNGVGVTVFATENPSLTAPPPVSKQYAEMMLLSVDKTTLRAELRTWPEDFKDSALLQTFRIAIGKVQGDKEREGDNKTPEGIYFAENILDNPGNLPSKYGPKAIPINFPNPIDRLLRKTGHGIWLHGAGNDQRIEESNVTEGCVAFYNADILRLINWLRPHQGAILIANDARQVNSPEHVAQVKAATDTWIEAWATRDLDAYAAMYAPEFSNQGMNLEQYRSYKERVFKSYKSIHLTMDNVRATTHPNYAVSIMNQDFSGDQRFKSNGRKVLYWNRQPDGRWLITREIFEDRRFEPLQYTAAELAALTVGMNKEASLQLPKSATPNH